MSFRDMPDLGPLTAPGATEYAHTALQLSKRAVERTRNLLDLPYGPDAFHKLDVFLPRRHAKDGLPALLFLHGGAWRHGFKEWMGFMAPAILSMPALFVSANYRLAPTVTYPEPLHDCLDALAWVHANIAGHGGDPSRIFVGGHSSGGHLAALMTLRRDLASARGLPADVVKGCFPLSATFSLERSQLEPGSRREAIVRLVLAADDDGRDGTALARVEGNTTCFFLAYGSNDYPEIIEQNRRMAAALRGQPCRSTLHVLAGFDHFQTHLDCARRDGPWIATVRRWMKECHAGAGAATD